jgi:hypothetical protein
MYRLNAATNRTGLGMLLKVMSGDKINILRKSYYHYSGGGVSNTPFEQFISQFRLLHFCTTLRQEYLYHQVLFYFC